MKTPLRVAWTEGLLMGPQHLQQHDRYVEGLIHARVDARGPLSWGILRVELDRSALAQGQLSLVEFAGVLPDGTVLDLGARDSELPPARPISFPPTQQSVRVYLGVPRERDGINNYAAASGGRERYVLEHRPIGDAANSGTSVEVALARRNVVFLIGDEPRQDMECVPIVEVTRDETGAFTLVEPFVPPVLRIDASPFLISGLRRILRLMTARQRSLSESRRERDAASVEFVAQDVSRYLLLSAINGSLPLVNYLSEVGECSPRELYFVLTRLAGELATFSTDFDPLSLPKYNQLDLRATYEELFARLTFLLQAAIREHFIAWQLDARQDGLHFATLADDRLSSCTKFFLAVRSPLPEQQMATTLPRLCKIASWTDVNGILTAATPGAPVDVTFRPPAEIPVKAGTMYFAVATDNVYWRNILAERNVAVYLPQPFAASATQVQLYGIPSNKV